MGGHSRRVDCAGPSQFVSRRFSCVSSAQAGLAAFAAYTLSCTVSPARSPPIPPPEWGCDGLLRCIRLAAPVSSPPNSPPGDEGHAVDPTDPPTARLLSHSEPPPVFNRPTVLRLNYSQFTSRGPVPFLFLKCVTCVRYICR